MNRPQATVRRVGRRPTANPKSEILNPKSGSGSEGAFSVRGEAMAIQLSGIHILLTYTCN